MVLLAQYNFEIPTMFAILIVLSLMGIISHIIVKALQRKFAFWGDSSNFIGN